MIVTNKKFAAAKGYALGQFVDDAEYTEWAGNLRAEQQAKVERILAEGNKGKGNMRVAFRHCHCGGRTFMPGETFYVSKVKGSAFGHWRLQHKPQQSSVFATMTMAELDSFSQPVQAVRKHIEVHNICGNPKDSRMWHIGETLPGSWTRRAVYFDDPEDISDFGHFFMGGIRYELDDDEISYIEVN